MKKIDIEHWIRKSNFDWFSTFTNPTFSFNVKVDVTDVVKYSKETKTSFFANFFYIISRVNNELTPFRLRYLDGEVVEFDAVHPRFTVKTKDGVFNTASFEYTPDYKEFYRRCREAIDINSVFTDNTKEFDAPSYDVFYASCLTSIELEGMTHPMNYDNKNTLNVPHIFWDKYRLENDRYVLLLNFTVSHIVMDGEDLAEALNLVKKYSLDFSKYYL